MCLAFCTAASRRCLAFEAAKSIITFTSASNRLSATKTKSLVALIAEDDVFALKTERLAAPFAAEHNITVRAHPLFAIFARCKVIITIRAEILLAFSAYDEPFTLVAELFTAREAPTSWHATKAFLSVTISTKAEMTFFGKVVTFSATKLAPRFHLAVFALIFVTTLYPLYKSNFTPMGYTKALAQMKHG